MAAKDADLARDFSLDFVYISMPTVAAMEVELATTPLMSAVDRTAELFLTGLPAGGVTYRMRGYDTTLARMVFWGSTSIDETAGNYVGPGPVINIVVQAVIGEG